MWRFVYSTYPVWEDRREVIMLLFLLYLFCWAQNISKDDKTWTLVPTKQILYSLNLLALDVAVVTGKLRGNVAETST